MNLQEIENKNPELKELLKNMPNDIRKRCIIKKFPEATVIHRKDYELKYFSIICEGEVKVINEFENGNLYIIERNSAIDFIGEVTALAGEKNVSVTIEAMTDCIAIQMDLSDFFQWMKVDNNLVLTIAKKVAKKLYNSSYTKGVELFYPTIHLMIDLIIKLTSGEIQKKNKVKIDLTREQISEKLGVTIRTVNRTIKKLKDEKMISIDKGKIQVNKEKFERLVDVYEDRKYL